MNDQIWFYALIALFGVLISGISQIMLKKSAMQTYDTMIKQYLNPLVIGAYALFFLSTICSVVSLKVLPLSMSPIWNASGHIFVTFFSLLFLGERPNKKKLCGLGIVGLGIVIFSIK